MFKQKHSPLSEAEIKKISASVGEDELGLARVFSALGDPGRFKIFSILVDINEMCVTDIAHTLGVSIPAASQQLRILENARLVKKERMGQTICYELNTKDPLVVRLIKIIK